MNNYWGPPDDEPLPDWMDPIKCRQVEYRKKAGKDLMSVINETLEKPAGPVTLDMPGTLGGVKITFPKE